MVKLLSNFCQAGLHKPAKNILLRLDFFASMTIRAVNLQKAKNQRINYNFLI